MIVFPNAKINLGLQVVAKRADGYHNIETVFYPIPLTDALEIEAREDTCDCLSAHGVPIDAATEDNLVMKAVMALRRKFDFPPLTIELIKHIPSGAGLGGGSSDASFMLKLVRDYFSLPIDDEELATIALTIGADCPFFVGNRPVLATDLGQVFTPLPNFSLSGLHIAIVKPPIHINTAAAYKGLKLVGKRETMPDEIVYMPVDEWRGKLVNDFEESLFLAHPRLAELKEMLYRSGALYAAMSGSGSALFGLFREKPQLDKATITDCFRWQSIIP
ncbi:4-(cytidine 5'-diphospho)-2-C-methyl-D-erythritol kinase [Porphyromonas gingivalis]|uniref:4-(cytidine 5'-diphospho)-2-C-methyl-D-erythritol kinase n=1 Tax=Porphyromonas gingivalis TaxID=837 RepID=UPI000BE7460E|nr:4-(cytidine 5'-diphospho)-2-C-methyl-D-erythritol kinase [Porphyromonas gingivalis]PDP48258.1 4-(cytidine 5'-diphospho)-2-C-methyl-D-erythritol kinase [Porphyromonas gingivalis]